MKTNAIEKILEIAAEIISDKTYSTNYASSDYETVQEYLPQARAELAVLTARVAELEQDKERLEWIFRNEAKDGNELQEPFVTIRARWNPHSKAWTWWIESYSSDAYPICTKSWDESHATFRAAIDAAMEER